MTMPEYPVAEVLPHAGPMILINEIVHWETDRISTQVHINQSSQFAQAAGVPTWVGIEYMAQTIAALAGCRARSCNKPVQIGFLVGSRKYSAQLPYFSFGSSLTVNAKELINGDNGLAVFECSIASSDGNSTLAHANINVFQPQDAKQFIREELV